MGMTNDSVERPTASQTFVYQACEWFLTKRGEDTFSAITGSRSYSLKTTIAVSARGNPPWGQTTA